MLTRAQIDSYVKEVPENIDADERRAAYATITGFGEDKSVAEIAQYYSLTRDIVIKWMDYFEFTSQKQEAAAKRSSKSKKIESYLKDNVGKTVTPKQVAEEVGMSLPTFYNFYNANRSYFKKVKRGEFEILDPKAERSK
jgi:transposase